MRSIYRMLPAILLVSLVSSISASTFGKISGYVTDEEGTPLAGANVVVEGQNRGASTDPDGFFYILNIAPGIHRVSARYMGYQTVTQEGVLVILDLTTSLNFQLEQTVLPGEEVVITAERSKIQRDATSTRQNITSEELEELPVTTVNDALKLQTGVIYSEGYIHVRGGRYGEVAYLLDGHRIEDPVYTELVADINAGAVEQIELVTGPFAAEYGNAMSGVLNISTKSTPSEFTGNVRYRMSGLGLEQPSDNLNERFVEGTFGGPICKRKRAGLLLSGRIVRKDNYYESGILGEDGQPTGKLSGEAFGYHNKNNLFAKLSFEPFANGKAAVFYNLDDRQWMNYDHVYKYAPDSAYVRTATNDWIGLNLSYAPGSTWFFELRGSYTREDYLRNYAGLHYSEYLPPHLRRWSENYEFRLTSNNASYLDFTNSTITGAIALNWQVTRHHLLKFGTEYRQHDFDHFYIANPRLSEENQYINDYHLRPYEGAAYIQDKLEFKDLVLNAGLRFDFYHPRVNNYIQDPNDPEGSITDATPKTQISPRLGVAYPVTDKTVFHFAYAHLFQRPAYNTLYSYLDRILTVPVPLIGDPDLGPERTVSYEFGLSTVQIPAVTLNLTLFSREIRDLIGISWQLKEPGFPLGYSYYSNEDFAYVKGFELNCEAKRGVLGAGANYTYSVAEGSGSTRTERYYGDSDIIAEQSLQYYPLDFDQRHTINAHVSCKTGDRISLFGIGAGVVKNSTVTLLFRYGSGFPYTYNPNREVYVSDLYNARKPYTYSFDLKAERRFEVGLFEVKLMLEIYNLLDRKNVRLVYTATGLPDDSGPHTGYSYERANDPTHYFDPRTIYAGLAVGF
jgi:outer membrane receptor for ferrienterochelin and colicin